MKALIITSRFPWPVYTGDRLRAAIWADALARDAEVTLVAPAGAAPADGPRLRFFEAQRSFLRGAASVLAVVRHGLPLQCLLSASYDWRAAIAAAQRESGPFDVTIVLLSRLHPWVRSSVQGRAVLDAIDSLRRSAEERRKAAGALTRWLWRMEERRMARLEQDAPATYERVVFVSDEETAEVDGAVAVTNGILTEPLAEAPRTFDFGFWGRLPYFANADAAAWLLEEIWPAIRALHPSATLILGGAGASSSLRDAAQRAGVTLVSPIENVRAFARNLRVALMPLRYGSGQSNKVLEAAEAGCAIVGTPQAFRGLSSLARYSPVASDAGQFARVAVELLEDGERRRQIAAQLREVVASEYARPVTLERLRAIARGVAA